MKNILPLPIFRFQLPFIFKIFKKNVNTFFLLLRHVFVMKIVSKFLLLKTYIVRSNGKLLKIILKVYCMFFAFSVKSFQRLHISLKCNITQVFKENTFVNLENPLQTSWIILIYEGGSWHLQVNYRKHTFFPSQKVQFWGFFYCKQKKKSYVFSLTSLRGDSFTLIGHPSGEVVTIKIFYGVHVLYNQPALHPIFSHWDGEN